MAGGYKELLTAQKLAVDMDKATGERHFIPDSAGTVELPNYGDSFGSSNPWAAGPSAPVACKLIHKRYENFRQASTICVVICEYSTENPIVPLDEFRIAGEAVTLPYDATTSTMTWADGSKVRMNLVKRNVTAVFVKYAAAATAAEALSGMEALGHVDSTGTWLWNGLDVMPYWAHTGTATETYGYKLRRIYEYRNIASTGTVPNGWNWMLDSISMTNKQVGTALYQTGSLPDDVATMTGLP
jgi:hypothetical protein